jgi:hypothetical protein
LRVEEGGSAVSVVAPEPAIGRELETISPELALVSPELAALARALLPDRPWEAFLPPEPHPPPPEVVVAPLPAGPLLAPRRRRGPWRLALGGIAAAVLAAGLVSFEILRDRGGDEPEGELLAPPLTEPAPITPGVTTTAGVPPVGAIRPVPGGGYIFGKGGTLLVSPDGSSIERFQAFADCAPKTPLTGIVIDLDGAFVAVGSLEGTAFELDGRFQSSRIARGFVRFNKAGCDSGKVAFVARLS